MKVRIKKLNKDAVVPKYNSKTDAGMDLIAISKQETEDYIEYGTGLALEIPEGYAGFIFPRSSISKHNLNLANSVGVIDSGYRGEIKFRFKRMRKEFKDADGLYNSEPANTIYEISDKIGQLIILPYPTIVWEVLKEDEELNETERGAKGFGSSGR